jgi:hypothetical protein
MRVCHACGPTWLLVAGIVVSSAGCTARNPRYDGVGGQADVDGDGQAALPDAESDGENHATTGPDASPEDPAADGGARDAPFAGPDASADGAGAAASLVAHWALDEGFGTATGDSTGNQNEGALINGPSWIVDAAPTAGRNPMALRLDGSDDYVDLGVRTLPRAEASKTIGIWFRNASGPPRLRNLVALFSRSDGTGIHVGFDQTKVAAWRWGDLDPIIVSDKAPDAGWHHLAYSWDGTTHHLYLDGEPVGSSTAAVRHGPTLTARLGTWELPFEVFGGDLDEVRVYSEALSDAEIATLAARR